jgi:CubicO group peptidase (beta-lactamase class C family)
MQLAPKQAGFSAGRLDRLTDHLNRNYLDPGKIVGCQLAVARHGQLAYHRSFGLMDRERAKPMTADTIFRIYSMTKPITSVALMMLYEQGHFQLNDPVSRFIPEWKDHRVWVSGGGDSMVTEAPIRPMTFRHLLNHSGGLTYGATDHPVDQAYRDAGVRRDRNEPLADFVKKLANVPLRFQPGERWMYSFSTDICGHLVEVISGRRLDDFFRENIFEPLGMTDTTFAVAPETAHRFAANYQREPDKSLALIDDPATSVFLKQPGFLSGGGGLTGTTADYLRFCDMLRQGGTLDGQRILGSRTLDLMRKNHLASGKDLPQTAIGAFSTSEGIGFGLGFAMTLDQVRAGGLGDGEYYWGGAASTIFWIDPKEDLIAVFMTQLMPSDSFNFRGQLKSIIYSSIEE